MLSDTELYKGLRRETRLRYIDSMALSGIMVIVCQVFFWYFLSKSNTPWLTEAEPSTQVILSVVMVMMFAFSFVFGVIFLIVLKRFRKDEARYAKLIRDAENNEEES